MPQELSLPDPGRFDLKSFAEILPTRAPIVGEEPGSFEGFREGMLRSLAPTTPYECVVAENLVSIEWELLQHRMMRDAGIRRRISDAIEYATVDREKKIFEDFLDEAYDAHIEAGGTEDNWVEPKKFDREVALAKGRDLAVRAVTGNLNQQTEAYKEVSDLGLDPVEVMSDAYRTFGRSAQAHEEKLPELERRRREVMRDYDLLQRSRPIDATVIEG